MPKCNKVKNPCKICLGSVNRKTGLQCQGACQTWVHYSCLNYTPGKIKDIKAGFIKVNCPCPDCETTQPKEYRTDEPFGCSNVQCPANQLPICGNRACPINKGRLDTVEVSVATGCALDKCGKGCKPNSHPRIPNIPQPQLKRACKPAGYRQPISPSASDACPPDGVSSQDVPGDFGRAMNPASSLGTLEHMCSTVGRLTNQINSLMAKMKQAVQDNGGCGRKGCTQNASKSTCPKACFCPGNPGRRT